MPDRQDIEERKLTTRLFLMIAAAIAVAGFVLFFLVAPMLSEVVAPGMGAKESAVAAFVVTLVLMVIMMIAAGDGLLGEIQFALPAFLVFFVILWFMIAWIF